MDKGNKTMLSDSYLDLGIINVKNYGALGDGQTDDTIAFINALKDLKNGGVFYVPASEKEYIISRVDIIDKNRCKFIFNGKIKLIDKANDNNVLTFWRGNDYSEVYGLYLDGNSPNAIDNGVVGGRYSLVIGKNQSNMKFINVTLVNSLYCGVLTGENLSNCIFENFMFINTGEHCFYLSGGGCKDLTFNNIYANTIGANKTMEPTHESTLFKIKSLNGVINKNFIFKNIKLNRIGIERSNYSVVFIPSQIDGMIAENIRTEGTNAVAIVLNDRVKNVYIYNLESSYVTYNAPLATDISNINLFNSYLSNVIISGLNIFSLIENCIFDNPWIRFINKSTFNYNTTIKKCDFVNISQPNAIVFDYLRNELNFIDCNFKSNDNVNFNQGIITFKNSVDSTLGNISFINCRIVSKWYYVCIQLYNDFLVNLDGCTISNAITNKSSTKLGKLIIANSIILNNAVPINKLEFGKVIYNNFLDGNLNPIT